MENVWATQNIFHECIDQNCMPHSDKHQKNKIRVVIVTYWRDSNVATSMAVTSYKPGPLAMYISIELHCFS